MVLNLEGSDLLTHELRGDFAFIGSAPSNHIVVDHPAVSEQHALLLRVHDSYWLKDLNSTNGRQINGVVVTEAEVKDGDKVRFGSVVAVFVAFAANEGQSADLEDSGQLLRSKPDAAGSRLIAGELLLRLVDQL